MKSEKRSPCDAKTPGDVPNPDNGRVTISSSTSVRTASTSDNSRGLDGAPDLQIDFQFRDTYRDNPTFCRCIFGKIDSIDSPGILFTKLTW